MVSKTHARSRGIPSDVEEILWWLPEDTESVVVARAPIVKYPSGWLLNRGVGGREEPRDPHLTLEQEVARANSQLLLLSAQFTRDDNLVKFVEKYLENGKVKLTLAAGRRYGGRQRRPFYEHCCFVVFEQDCPEEMTKELEKYASQTHVIRGQRVFQADYAGGQCERDCNMYIANPTRQTLVVATDLDLLNTVFARVKQRPKTRALAPRLAEWKHVDVLAPAWGIRHYQTSSTETSATPIRKRDRGAQGLTFSYTPKPAKVLTVRYLSSSGDSRKLLGDYLEERLSTRITISAQHAGNGVVEVRFAIRSLDEPQQPGVANLAPQDVLLFIDLIGTGFPY